MNENSLLNHLTAYVQDEIAVRRRTLDLLSRQEAGIQNNDPGATAKAVEAIEQEMKGNSRRNSKRVGLIKKLALCWSLPADALTLGSIVERAGARAGMLAELREELRALTAKVLKRNRRLSALIGMHRRVIKEVIDTVLHEQVGAVMNGAGSLIDAEA